MHSPVGWEFSLTFAIFVSDPGSSEILVSSWVTFLSTWVPQETDFSVGSLISVKYSSSLSYVGVYTV